MTREVVFVLLRLQTSFANVNKTLLAQFLSALLQFFANDIAVLVCHSNTQLFVLCALFINHQYYQSLLLH